MNDSVDSGIDCKDRKDAWLTKKNHIQPREELSRGAQNVTELRAKRN